MRTYRIMPCLMAMLVVLGVVGGCSRGPSEEELKQAELAEQFATIQQLSENLNQTRADLSAAVANLEEIQTIKERERTDEQKTMLEELPAQIEELVASQDAEFEEVQATLAEYLNVALNEFPGDSDTGTALAIYSEEAIVVAKDMIEKSGDYKKAIDHLISAQNLFEQVGLTPYPPLGKTITEFDDWRFITKERFDAVKNGMTKDQVKVTTGIPYYQNIQVDEKRGVEMWLYRKRDGGAAAISFKTKDEKVYHKNFDAVKTKVAE